MTEIPLTTADYVRHWATERPDHVALRWDGGRLTYAELDERSSRVAQALQAAGVGPADRVAFLDENGPEQIELYFGAAKLNAVPCPINYRLAPPEIELILSDSEAKVFVVGEEFAPAVARDRDAVPVVVMGAEYEAWIEAHDPVDPHQPQASGDVAYQLYSSGTTGRPKGVQLTQGNIDAGLSVYPEILGIGPDSVSLVAMPLYHIGGGGWALVGLRLGATDVLVREIVPDQLVDTVLRERVTHGFLVPAVLQFMLGVPGIGSRDFSALEALLYGASPISEKVLSNAIATFGCRFVQAYGLSESTGTVVYLPAADHDPDGPNPQRLRGVGLPVPGTEARIADAFTGGPVKTGEVGEIWIKGPTVMLGYWHLPEQTAAAITPDGWLRTGDAGYQDPDGYLYVHDRVKDMIVSGGENIYPAEVENVIMSHPEVADVAVIGIPSDKWGETPRAMVVRAPGRILTEEALISHCRERLAGFKCPTSVEWIAELPRNPSGKVLKKDLRAPFWLGRERKVN